MLSTKVLDQLSSQGVSSLYPMSAKIVVGRGTCGDASGAKDIFESIAKHISDNEIDCHLSVAGCRGICWAEPIVEVRIPGFDPVLYGNVDADLAERIVLGVKDCELPSDHILGTYQISEFDLPSSQITIRENDSSHGEMSKLEQIPFWGFQHRRVMGRCGISDPSSIEEYVATGGYKALAHILEDHVDPEEIIADVCASGLRGRGGAGYPTGEKWKKVLDKASDVKYVIANGDEGDPGAFMDRCLMESDPFAIIEGLTIAGYAIGAHLGYVFVRSEYPKAISALEHAIKAAEEMGFLGSLILGSDWDFDIRLVRSAGAYVCGEATAMINAMEGKPGKPRKKPPHTSDSGLWGKPTCVNNVETLANVAPIVSNGPEWFRSVGTYDSPGTKVFSIAGAVEKVGLVEVPLGIGIEQLVNSIAGCDASAAHDVISDNYKNGTVHFCADADIKTLQVGGPSGIFLPKGRYFALDYESLADIGGSIGSGGLIFVGKDDCIVDMARYFIRFSVEEDCGQCRRAKGLMDECLEVLSVITEGKGDPSDIARLSELCEEIPSCSLCGHGRMAMNPLRSSLKFFRDEYDSHLDGVCPARVCRKLIHFQVIPELCPGCRCCAPICPTNAMQGKFGKPYSIVDRLCIRCKMCVSSCPYHAVELTDVQSVN